MIRVLSGHDSETTAYVVADYPYGFRLRCQIRYWIETTKHGQRVVSQTSNPKRPGLVWNKPKKGTYHEVAVLFLDDEGHVQNDALSPYMGEDKIQAFVDRYASALTDERSVKIIRLLTAVARAQKNVKVTVRELRPGEVPQSREEQQAIMRTAVGHELREMGKGEP